MRGRFPRNLANHLHHPAQFSLSKPRSDPARDGEQANLPATATDGAVDPNILQWLPLDWTRNSCADIAPAHALQHPMCPCWQVVCSHSPHGHAMNEPTGYCSKHVRLCFRYGCQPCTARVSLSDLRMPLMWRDTDHFKNKGDYRRFAVFCLARIGTEIYDTTLLCPVDRSLTDLTFPDILLFNQIPADFEFRLEVYSHILQDDLSIASTPRKIKKTIHSSISRTVGKKLAASLRDELNSGKIGPHFELMATAQLTLNEVHDSIHTHDLKVECAEPKSHQLPLFGHFCCRLAAQPECVSTESCSGDMWVQEGGQWAGPMWAQLQAFRLDMWSGRADWEQGHEPLRTIPVDRDTVIQPSKTSTKELLVLNRCEGKEELWVLRTKISDELLRWLKHLVQHSKDHFRWRHAAEKIMDIQTPGSARHSFTRGLRQGSLYDETPLIESVSSEFHRPTVQEIFSITPSTSLSSCASSSSSPTFRERAYSSGGSKTRQSAWPLSRNNHE
ncbi:hypothetical protein PR048_024115 [Dryococelus australis]|uniref:Anillin homology domain-containing protein n=1 Tax=Dryococelus australis TaxID=614101 RepID=A0ABQ9GVZ7_9NEOP|nr:hypothetical protein PR048_024115 [Dryococelus australis]